MHKTPKEQLIDEIISIGGNNKINRTRNVKEKVLNYIKENGADKQIEDFLIFLELHEEEAKHNDFKKLYKMAEPLLDRLTYLDSWDKVDIELLSVAIAYTETYEQAILLFKQAFREIEKYRDNQKYFVNIKSSYYSNTPLRLVRAKRHDLKHTVYKVEAQNAELDSIFDELFEEAIKFFDENNFPIHKSVIIIRKGIFYNDIELINMGLSQLKEKGEHKLHEIMLKDVEDFLS
ncbi:MAG: hypothetical protein FWF57_08525 [Defluviitaleaceae bacterium]|nr:hypothetical protein [Defluviitaleaceae bacterium]